MDYRFLLKILVSALIIAGSTEVSKRSTLAAAILISLPLTSILALSWMHVDGQDSKQISSMSMSVLWLVLPSLSFFLVLSRLLDSGMRFWMSLALACLATAVIYTGFTFLTSLLNK